MRKQRGETICSNANAPNSMHPHNGAPTPSSSVSSSGSNSTTGSSLGSAGVGNTCVLSPPSSAQTNGTGANGSAIGCMIPAQTSLDQNPHSVALAAAATGASQQLNGSSGAASPSALNGRYNQGVAHSFIQPNQMYTSLTQNPMDPYSFGMTQDFGSYFQRPYDFNVRFEIVD